MQSEPACMESFGKLLDLLMLSGDFGTQIGDVGKVLSSGGGGPVITNLYTNKSKVRISIFLKIGCFYIFYCKFYSPAESFTFFS